MLGAIFVFAIYLVVSCVLRYVCFHLFKMVVTRRLEVYLFYFSLVSGFTLGHRVEELIYSILGAE